MLKRPQHDMRQSIRGLDMWCRLYNRSIRARNGILCGFLNDDYGVGKYA